jgi:sialic acid synthase SpsE
VAAKEAGADAVKFQTHTVEDEQYDSKIVSPHFIGADRHAWVTRNSKITSGDFWMKVKKIADDVGITFFSTAMTRGAAQILDTLDVPFWKVGSGDVEDYVLLDHISSTGKPIIISTGMVSRKELDVVLQYLATRPSPVVVLYCVSQYPCPKAQFNLASIEYLREKYPDVVIGFSDHSVDSHEVSLAAIKLGARVIEKHFSFSRTLWGSDHKASITPGEMKNMVHAIRRGDSDKVDVEAYYGSKELEFEGAHNAFRPYFKKSLVAGRNIRAGETITKGMVYAMRPEMHIDGFPSRELFSVIGKKALRNLKKYDPINKTSIL